jgi:hypothetical protein
MESIADMSSFKMGHYCRYWSSVEWRNQPYWGLACQSSVQPFPRP